MNKILVIAISGKQGSGKTTLAKSIRKAIIDKGVSCRTMKFADPLYEMQDAIQEVMGHYGVGFKTPDGKLLQLLGTEWGRNTLGDDIWPRILTSRIEDRMEMRSGLFSSVIIVDDCRFPNELAALKKLEALTIRLECSETLRRERAEKWRENTAHPSEVALDGHADFFDLKLNSETMDQEEILKAAMCMVEVRLANDFAAAIGECN